MQKKRDFDQILVRVVVFSVPVLLKLCLLCKELGVDGVQPVDVMASSLAVVKNLFIFLFY